MIPNPAFLDGPLVHWSVSKPTADDLNVLHGLVRMTSSRSRRCDVWLNVDVPEEIAVPGLRHVGQCIRVGKFEPDQSDHPSPCSIRIQSVQVEREFRQHETDVFRFVLDQMGYGEHFTVAGRLIEPVDPVRTELRQAERHSIPMLGSATLAIRNFGSQDEGRDAVDRYLTAVGGVTTRAMFLAEIPDAHYDALRPVLNDALSWWTYQGTGMLRPGIETYEGMMAGVAEGVDWVPLFMHEGRVTVDGVQHFTTKVVAACPTPEGVRLEINCDWLDPERIIKQVAKATGLEWELIVPPPERGEVHA